MQKHLGTLGPWAGSGVAPLATGVLSWFPAPSLFGIGTCKQG